MVYIVAAAEGVVSVLELARINRCGVGERIFRAMSLESRPRVVFGCELLCLVLWRRVCCSMIVACVGCVVWPGCDSSCQARCGAVLRQDFVHKQMVWLQSRSRMARRRGRECGSQARLAWMALRLTETQQERFFLCICAEMASGMRSWVVFHRTACVATRDPCR